MGVSLVSGKVWAFAMGHSFLCSPFMWSPAAKSGVIGLGLVLAFLCYVIVMRLKGRTRVVLLVAALALVAGAVWLQGPLVKARMANGVHAMQNAFAGNPAIYTSSEGSDMRTVVWLCSWERCKRNLSCRHRVQACIKVVTAPEGCKPKTEFERHNNFLQGALRLGGGLVSALLISYGPVTSHGVDTTRYCCFSRSCSS